MYKSFRAQLPFVAGLQLTSGILGGRKTLQKLSSPQLAMQYLAELTVRYVDSQYRRGLPGQNRCRADGTDGADGTPRPRCFTTLTRGRCNIYTHHIPTLLFNYNRSIRSSVVLAALPFLMTHVPAAYAAARRKVSNLRFHAAAHMHSHVLSGKQWCDSRSGARFFSLRGKSCDQQQQQQQQ